MNERKRIPERYAFYDRCAMERRLEEMAEKGWTIEKLGTYLWTYRKTPPRRVHVAITYLAGSSQFDPSPTEEEETLEELCRRDGWVLTARSTQMQIFYNEQEDPTPIETDPVIQVENIHRAMKKSVLPGQTAMLVLGLWMLWFDGIYQVRQDVVGFLSEGWAMLMTALAVCILLEALFELGHYVYWTRKAPVLAEKGVFLELKTNRICSLLLEWIPLVLLLLAILNFKIHISVFIVGALAGVIPIFLGRGLLKLLRKRGVSRRTNYWISITAVVLMMFLFLGLLGHIAFRFGWMKDSQPVGTYEEYGMEMDVYDEDLPLRVEDLFETDQTAWSLEKETQETPFLRVTECLQWGLTMEDVPRLEYTVIDVKMPGLYEICRDGILRQQKDVIRAGEVVFVDHYEAVDAAPWKAEEAYQRIWQEYRPEEYLLCYENRIVLLDTGDPIGEEGKTIVAEKLGLLS